MPPSESATLPVSPNGSISTEIPDVLAAHISECELENFLKRHNRARPGLWKILAIVLLGSALVAGAILIVWQVMNIAFMEIVFFVLIGVFGAALLAFFLVWFFYKPTPNQMRRHLIRVCTAGQAYFSGTVWQIQEEKDLKTEQKSVFSLIVEVLPMHFASPIVGSAPIYLVSSVNEKSSPK